MARYKDGKEKPLNTPFLRLPALLSRPGRQESSPRESGAVSLSEVMLFREAVGEVIPLKRGDKLPLVHASPPPKRNFCPCPEPVEVMQALAELVQGISAFDPSCSDEYMQWKAPDLNPEVFERLKQGKLSVQAHLDLHHMSSGEACSAVNRFIWESYAEGLTCVLIIHGRGRNSKNRVPVLKRELEGWLRKGRCRKMVRAYASARRYDGGLGALYVLLEPSRKYLHRA